jgi:hypothetical protein
VEVALEGVVGRIAVVIDASGEHTSPLPIVRLLAERRWRGRKRQVVQRKALSCSVLAVASLKMKLDGTDSRVR